MSDLLITYGVAFLCGLGCSAVGLYAFFVNDESYQNLFSTYVRATNASDLRLHADGGDKGADPCLACWHNVVSLLPILPVNLWMQNKHGMTAPSSTVQASANQTLL